MISNINHSPLRTFPNLESYWNNGNIYEFKTPNYPTLKPEDHYTDGWRDVVIPDLKENQRRGQLIYNKESDTVTYEVIDIPESELKQRVISQAQGTREEVIQAKIKAQVETELQAITDDSEALENAPAFPIWEDLEDGFDFKNPFKVQALVDMELKLFKIITPHLKQSDWHPNITPALWSKIEFSGGIEVWAQPTGGDGKYPYLDPSTGLQYQVTHNGQTWRNIHQGGLNVWAPGVFGWVVVN